MATFNLNQALSSGGLSGYYNQGGLGGYVNTKQVPAIQQAVQSFPQISSGDIQGAKDMTPYSDNRPSAPSGYGTDPNFNYSGWGQEFGTGAAGQAAYEAYRQQQELGPQIDAAYAPQEDYLNQTEQFYKNQLPGYQQEANKNYDVNKQLLGTSLKNANTSLDTQQTQGQRATEDAMAKARRIFMEQQIGAQQRFGGSSSAGGAMSELLARNLQSETGQTQRQAVDYTQQIGQLRQQAQQKFDDSVMQLEQQKQKALNDIQREFDQKMLEISNNRTQLTSAKAQMKLQALMDLRNKTFAIQQQATQLQQALGTQKQAAEQQLAQYGQTVSGAVNQGQSALKSFTGNLDNQTYGVSTPQSTQTQQGQYIGQIGKSLVGKDELGRSLYSDGTAGWTQWSK